MKIAIASSSKDKDGEISQRGGRSPFFQIFDQEGTILEVIKNPVEQGGGGVGPYVAKMLADKKVKLFVAEKIGPNMAQAFEQHGVKYKEMSGSVNSTVKEMIDKK